jgi:hypothetical protein
MSNASNRAYRLALNNVLAQQGHRALSAQGESEKQRQLIQVTLAAPTRSLTASAGRATLSEKIYVYQLPTDASDAVVRDYMWYLHLCLMGKDNSTINCWMNVMATFCITLFAAEYENVQTSTYIKVPLSRQQLSAIKTIVDYTFTAGANLDRQWIDARTNALQTLEAVALPQLKHTAIEAKCRQVEMSVWYGLLGVLVLAATKNIDSAGSHALTTNRFAALMSRFSWDATTAFPLSEHGRPNDIAFGGLNLAWVRLVGYKRATFKFTAKLLASEKSAEEEAYLTTTRLMRFAELSHIIIIHSFIQRYAWASLVPSLEVDAQNYFAGLRQLYEMCEPLLDHRGNPIKNEHGTVLRDSAEMPYLKMIYGDSLDLAKRDGMLKLLYVAWSVLKETETTLNDYEVPDSFPTALAEFQNMKRDLLELAVEQDAEDAGAAAEPLGDVAEEAATAI